MELSGIRFSKSGVPYLLIIQRREMGTHRKVWRTTKKFGFPFSGWVRALTVGEDGQYSGFQNGWKCSIAAYLKARYGKNVKAEYVGELGPWVIPTCEALSRGRG